MALPALCLSGFTDSRCNGVYTAESSEHFVNERGFHLFVSRRTDEWCVREEFDPNARSALAIASWGPATSPPVGESLWQIWQRGRWASEKVLLAVGGAAAANFAEMSRSACAAQLDSVRPPDWAGLSKEIVMHVLHHTPSSRSRGAIACVCRPWRDASTERRRRPSVLPSTTLSMDTCREWTARRMAASPHSFG